MQGYKTAAMTWTVEFAHCRNNSSNLTRRGWRHPSGLAGSSLRCTSPSSPQSRSGAPPPFAGHISEQSKRKRHDVTFSVANFKNIQWHFIHSLIRNMHSRCRDCGSEISGAGGKPDQQVVSSSKHALRVTVDLLFLNTSFYAPTCCLPTAEHQPTSSAWGDRKVVGCV